MSAGPRLDARRSASTLWLCAACVCALAAWLFLPRVRAAAPVLPRLRAVLVDVSASVVRAPDWLPWSRAELRRLALEARAAAEELCVVSFADGVATGFSAGDPERFLQALEGRAHTPFDAQLGLAPGATRLAAALEAVIPALTTPQRRPGALVLLAPLTYTGASPESAFARLAEAGVTVHTRAPPRPAASDLGLLELELAARVEAGARLVARARLVLRRASVPPDPAVLELEFECAGERRTLTQPLRLPAQDGELELALDCGPAGPGRNQLEARVRLASGPDLLPENDRARAQTLGEGARVIGVLSTPEFEPLARAWLAPDGRSALAGLQFQFLAPAQLGPEFEHLSALVSFDLALRHLPEGLLAAFVQRGGGWLATCGWGFLEDWTPAEGEGVLARLLPCAPAPENAAERDVVLLVDGSGSMEGEAFESVRAAALELVSAASPSDRVGLRFFTARLEPEHLLKERSATRAEDAEAARRAARELLALRVPAGSTSLLGALRELSAGLGERETLVLLLSDGRERQALADPLAEARALVTELARRRARLAVIAVGEAQRPLLAALAGGDERVHDGGTLAELRAVFRRELFAGRVAEGELALRWAARAPGSLADEVASAAAGDSALAPLERHVQSRLRAGGEGLWESAQGEPVLALARAGLGRTALFGALPAPGWASRYARAGTPDEFEGLLRWLARGPERGPAPRARFEGERLVLRGLDPRAPAELAARLLDLAPRGAPEELRLVASGELPHEVLRTRVARPTRLDWSRPVLELAASGAEPALALAVERSLPDEFAWREATVAEGWLVARADRRTGLGELPRRSHPAAPWVLALGLVLVLAAAFATLRGQGVRTFGR